MFQGRGIGLELADDDPRLPPLIDPAFSHSTLIGRAGIATNCAVAVNRNAYSGPVGVALDTR
jgi:hypothetical protein